MKRIIITTLLFLFFRFGVFAQTEKSPYLSTGFLYNKENVVSLGLSTQRGYFASYELGKIKTYYKTTFFRVGMGELKARQEFRQSADPGLTRTFRPYVLGKENAFFPVRVTWGTKRYYSEKARKKGVAVGMSYTFGPTLGLLKPYYLALRRPLPDRPGESRISHERYTPENADVFLNPTRILGASNFSRGFQEINFIPGGSASASLHLDIGTFDDLVKAIEIGAMLDVFPKAVPIMAEGKNQRVFLSFFASIQFGKRR